jgi:hypothetical protein
MFYTYLWLREDGTPYYAGKGSGRRGHISGRHGVNRRPKDSLRIITQEWSSEQDAFDAEKFLIIYYGRLDMGTGCLRNLTDGGEGASGCIQSEEAKNKKRLALLGKPHSEERRKRQSESHKGKKRSEEALKKASETMRRLWAIGAFANRKKPNRKNYNPSEETRKKISNTVKRRWEEGAFRHTSTEE